MNGALHCRNGHGQEEVRKHNDLVMLRGEDAYDNLPSKTVMPSCCVSETHFC